MRKGTHHFFLSGVNEREKETVRTWLPVWSSSCWRELTGTLASENKVKTQWLQTAIQLGPEARLEPLNW